MKLSTRTLAIAGATLACVAATLGPAQAGGGPATDSTIPTFTEYKSWAHQDLDGQYIVNGDEAIADTGSLRQYFDSMTADRKTGHQLEEGLIVNTVQGRDDKWSASQALNLTYCVSNKFGTAKTNIVNAMNTGAGLWESASSKVNFIYVPSADSNCTVRNNAVLFSVEPTNTTQYIARAFFPSSPDRNRNVLVNAASLMNAGSWTPGNIMGHELGHTLGFRHEHTRPEAGTCFEDNNWRALTPYDSASIMHYPQCNGTSDDLSMTASDRAGVQALYGS